MGLLKNHSVLAALSAGFSALVGAAPDIYQAEDASFHNARIRTDHAGYDGSGYIDCDGNGASITFVVYAPSASMYEVGVKYASANPRPCELHVDGSNEAHGTYPFDGSGWWWEWHVETMAVELDQGYHTLEVAATNSAGPNIDWLSVEDTKTSKTHPTSLSPHDFLNSGDFIYSPSGFYKFGLDDGDLVFEDVSVGSVLWSAGVTGAVLCKMQGDGNLVVRNAGNAAIWASGTHFNDGAQVTVTNSGVAEIKLGGSVLWATPVSGPAPLTPEPTREPTQEPTQEPTREPVAPVSPTNPNIPETVVLGPNSFLEKNSFRTSPSGEYRVELTSDGDLVLRHQSGTTIWSAGTNQGSQKGYRCYMQSDGNVIVRSSSNAALWTSRTSNNHGSTLVVDDGGRISVQYNGIPIWMEGIPRGTYQIPSQAHDLQFPIRAAFYYAWYPETWTVNGALAKYEPTLGYYKTGDSAVARSHVDQLDYGHVKMSIVSWWGQDSTLDRARITLLMEETLARNSPLKWSAYHEDERDEDPPPSKIKSDLDYLKKWFAWHPAWAHIDRKPVIFVYNEGGCEIADRWHEASSGEWYVVLKLFPGFLSCPNQPDSWHQYGPADEVVHIGDWSYGVSPGFWRADMPQPLLPQVDKDRFCSNVASMVASNEKWQLITTFNEAGEGTMVESAVDWASPSGYGDYLDCLHDNY